MTDSTTKLDISWLQLLTGYGVAAGINGAIRHLVSPLSVPIAEQIMFSIAFLFPVFLLPASVILTLHIIGRRMATGFSAPKKVTLICGCIFASLLLCRFLLKR